MIHGNSNDPIFIKKIPLRIWTLRAEIESVLASQTENLEKKPDLNSLVSEYTTEDKSAMAAGIEGGGEETSEDTEEPLSTGPNKKTESDLLKIFQRSPKIPEEKLFKGKAVLSEISMDEMYFFSNKSFLAGQSIVIEFVVPKRFVANAIVSFCRNYNMQSRIISPNRLSYRVGIKFSFLKKGERTLLRQFISSIEPEVEALPVDEEGGAPSAASSSPEDSFDELDDLDL